MLQKPRNESQGKPAIRNGARQVRATKMQQRAT